MTETTDRGLYDYTTNELLGDATAVQAEASDAAGAEGVILIDAEGNVRHQSEYGADAFRSVYVGA